MNKKVVLLISGGIDSSTLLADLSNKGYEIHAISFNYMQRHNIELDKVKEFIKDYNIGHRIINIDLRQFGGSALTDSSIEVPKYKDHNEVGDDIPLSYVPARNTIFLSYALGFAETIGASDIFLGVHAADAANYPDCRPKYVKAFEIMANLATRVGVDGGGIKIHAPFIHLSKAEIVSKGLELGVDYSKTISCYDPSAYGESCGTCHACLIRIEAFQKNKMEDPVLYAK